jgi:methylthioribulose-1-phosphate dehydratase
LFLAEGEFTFSQFEIQKGLGFSDISEACLIPIFQNKTDLNLLAEDIAARVQPDHIGLLVEKHGLFVWGKSIVDAQRHTELLHHMFEYVLLKNGNSLALFSEEELREVVRGKGGFDGTH